MKCYLLSVIYTGLWQSYNKKVKTTVLGSPNFAWKVAWKVDQKKKYFTSTNAVGKLPKLKD